MTDVVEKFEAILPVHKVSLHLTHNQHLGYYETVEEYLGHFECPPLFSSDSEKEEAIISNDLWELQWYPDTPIGSYSIAAPTLAKLMAFAEVARDD